MADVEKKIRTIDAGAWGTLEGVDAISEASGSRIARDFITKIVRYTAKRSFDFHEYYDVDDYPLRYDERRLNSLIAASIDKITPCYLSEHAVRRYVEVNDRPKCKILTGPTNKTRVDFWAFYRGQNILIEVKRASMSPTSINANHRFVSRWLDIGK